MKNKYCFTAVMLLTVALCAYLFTNIYVKNEAKTENNSFTVVTSFYPMYIATANIVGNCEDITVQNLSEPQTGCLHDFQMTPEDMKLLSTADVFVINGGGMESFLEDVIAQYPELIIVETIETEDVHEHSEEEEHMHEEEASHEEHEHIHDHANAHAWMSVLHYREQVEYIANALCEAMPESAGKLRENARVYDTKLAELQAQQQEILQIAAGNKIVSFHEAYEYLAEDYGLEICYTLNLDEERQVSAGEVADVLEIINESDVEIIFAEELYGSELSDTIQNEADVTVCYLDTLVRGEYDLDSYIHGMQENINILKQAFGVK
ncbi:MAG: zinc ABC transporter substrate-binding protein [Lachnospiraceae bacterium]|nr:zinc ABC transporter substrate-binding protein [Lachnospiraceae bacterium]